MLKGEFKFIVHPGKILEGYLKSEGYTQTKFAELTNISKTEINEIIRGKRNISETRAIAFEEVLGIPATFWNKLQSDYNDKMLRQKLKTNKKSNDVKIQIMPQYSYPSTNNEETSYKIERSTLCLMC